MRRSLGQRSLLQAHAKYDKAPITLGPNLFRLGYRQHETNEAIDASQCQNLLIACKSHNYTVVSLRSRGSIAMHGSRLSGSGSNNIAIANDRAATVEPDQAQSGSGPITIKSDRVTPV